MKEQSDWHTSQMIEILDEVWATDEWLAEWYFYIANSATKSISTRDDWLVTVPDYSVRKATLDSIAKMKWAFNSVWKTKKRLPTDLIYVFKD